MQEEQKKLKKKLTTIYWINILIILGLTLFVLFNIGINGKSDTEGDFVWERFGIILTIAVIPLSLKLFHDHHKKITQESLAIFVKKLNTIFILRILALDSVILLNLIGFYFIGALNFMYMAGITIFVFLVCYPTQNMIDPVEKEIIETNDNNDEL